MRYITISLFVLSIYLGGGVYGALSDSQRNTIDQITGTKGVYTQAENVHKVSFPRTDVKVAVDKWPMPPFMGLTSWAAFSQGAFREAVVMGDLVVFEDEVNPVLSAALDSGLEVTALHNHFFYDSPKVMFMHIGGESSLSDLAKGVRKCMDKVKEIRAANPVPASSFGTGDIPLASSISAATLDHILGLKGQTSNGMYKAVIGRSARMHSKEIGNQLGVNTWAAFAGSDDHAVVDGDFAMTTNELQAVLKSLRSVGINIVAIHNHMTHEEPQFVFLHYWGKGKAGDLARGIHSALDKQALTGSRELTHPGH